MKWAYSEVDRYRGIYADFAGAGFREILFRARDCSNLGIDRRGVKYPRLMWMGLRRGNDHLRFPPVPGRSVVRRRVVLCPPPPPPRVRKTVPGRKYGTATRNTFGK